ncbi:MAG: DNA polymerase III subunit alpha [Myxococcales bacterium]|nr:DNA polymerase III subunit alpha [Myxococcales bacterium]
MADFTHLHLHTAYSFLDGAIHMADLVPRITELGMDACAVTDHGNLFGAIDFYRRAKKAGIKPIIGAELYVAADDMHKREQQTNHHLVVLAKNATGYANLMYLVSKGYLDGFYRRPRVDKKLVAERSEGLIATSACLGGEVPRACKEGDMDRARTAALELRSMFAPEHLFLEIQENQRPEQDMANNGVKQLARDLDIPLVATNDCHYMMREDAAAHDVLMAIGYQKLKNDPTRYRRGSDAFYVKAVEEMKGLFKDCPEAIDNTRRITEMVDLELKLGQPELPNFHTPDGSDLPSYLQERAFAGLEQRFKELVYPVDKDLYRARLERELGIITSMKFPGYFLIVADFINWAKQHDIPVGPGRGSGAGSLVAYSLRITDLDPIPYNLLFERFLNPERVSMPDFDIDFCQERRGDVMHYVTDKYGVSRVGQIATFAQMKAKSVIKDVARCLELPFHEVNELTKLIPNVYKDEKGNTKPINLEKAVELEPRLREKMNESDTYREVIEVARKLEGLYRQAGMHAAGIVIGNSDLWEVVPCFKGSDDELVTQFNMVDVEDAGLVKFDFLGLKTLDVIYGAEQHVNKRIEEELKRGDVEALLQHPHIRRMSTSIEEFREQLSTAVANTRERRTDVLDLTLRGSLLNLDDPAVYRLISKGATLGVFQLESTGFQQLLKRLKPDCFEDVVAAVALYRPGPLQTGMVEDFIDCKQGRKKVTYPHPLLEDTLKPTYGGFVYQEQVMQAAQVMAGYSLGGADLLRRAMGKKKIEVMAKERVKFVNGCGERNIGEPEATSVFDLMEKFAGYGFNKSHSAAYALITYQTGYLKAHYPVEFMAALLSTEVNNTDNIVKYIAEARSMGIEVIQPSVNDSEVSFTVPEGRIRFGLAAIKGLGDAALHAILATRRQDGAFGSLYDFCERVPLKQLTKKTLEVLIKSGALDTFERPRAQLVASMEGAIDAAKSMQRAKDAGQGNLFGAKGMAEAIKPREVYQDEVSEWAETERLRAEKEAIGFYITGHPLDRYKSDVRGLVDGTVAAFEEVERRQELRVCCLVSSLRDRPLRDGGGRMAFAVIEDQTGVFELIIGARVFGETEDLLRSGQPIIARIGVSVDIDDAGAKTIRARMNGAQSVAEARRERSRLMTLAVSESEIDVRRLEGFRTVIRRYPGQCRIRMMVSIDKTAEVELNLPRSVRVDATDEVVDAVEQLFGVGAVRFA